MEGQFDYSKVISRGMRYLNVKSKFQIKYGIT